MAVAAAEEYRATLDELTSNDKLQINLLTILAEDYAEYSSEITDTIEKFMNECPKPLKIAVLYVVDSIMKNVPVLGGYRNHFQRRIVRMFVHVFQESDEKVRSSLYKLRNTWTEIFTRGKLYEIDIKVREIDKKWPLQPPTTSAAIPPTVQPQASVARSASGGGAKEEEKPIPGGNIHLNPNFLPKPGQTTSAPLKSAMKRTPTALEEDDTARVPDSVKRRKLPSSATKRTVLLVDPATEAGGKSKVDRAAKDAEELLAGASMDSDASPVKRKKEPKQLDKRHKQPHSTEKREGRMHKRRSASTTKSSELMGAGSGEKAPVEAQHGASPTSDSVEGRTTATKGDTKEAPNSTETKNQKTSSVPVVPTLPAPVGRIPHLGLRGKAPHHSAATSAPQQPSDKQQQQQFVRRPPHTHPPPPSTSAFDVKPLVTTQPGSHAFVTPPPGIQPGMQAGIVSQAPLMGPFTQPPPVQQLPPSGFTPQQFQQQVVIGAPPMSVPPPAIPRPPFPAPMAGHTITSDAPRFTGVPANNRIFVDGRAYEVMFVDDVAVIERNGLPHRVFFTGPPRNVLIDGVPYFMNFDEPKVVLIDGAEHVLRFGAPSRELYMGNYPFKGCFGGPPIYATIDGTKHEIKLCGPPPEVKIEPQPSYELARHMQSMLRETVPPPSLPDAQAKVKKEVGGGGGSGDMAKWLETLQKTGVLNQVAKVLATETETVGPNKARGPPRFRETPLRPPSPPIPCNYRLENVERRPEPSALEQFTMRSLLIRYDSVVEAIHRPRIVCPQCGITFKELYGPAYQAHTDWHLQETIQARDKKYSRSSPWYMTDEWFTYSETELANRPPPSGEEQASEKQTTNDARSEDTAMKDCCVCHERFEEYWDEDDDAWKLRDCLIEAGKAFHSYCKSDVHYAADSTDGSGFKNEDGKNGGVFANAKELETSEDTIPFVETSSKTVNVDMANMADPLALVENVLEQLSSTSTPLGENMMKEVKQEPASNGSADASTNSVG